MAKSRARKLADIIVGAGIDIDGNLTFDGGSTSADLTFADNDKANFGDASDLQIYHDGSSNLIQGSNGILYIQAKAGENSILATPDGGVNLYHDNSLKFETTSSGAKFSGILAADDNQSILLGTGSDLRIKHDGTDSIIADEGGGDLIFKAYDDFYFKQVTDDANILRLNTGGDATFYGHVSLADDKQLKLGDSNELVIYHTASGNSIISEAGGGSLYLDGTNIYLRKSTASGETMGAFVADGAATLYYDNSAKLATTSGGVAITGTANASTYAATGDSDTYFNFPAANQLSLVGGGAEIVRAYQLAGAYGILRVNGSGSATYPNFTFNGDDNTGMYQAAADNLAFATGGSERVRIDSSGRVGIGTSSLSEKLTVAGPIGVSATGYTANATTANFGLYTSGSVDTTYLQMPASGQFQIWKPSTAAVVTVLESGNMGIGTTTPGATLEVKGGNGNNFRLNNDGSAYTEMIFQSNGTSKANLQLVNNDFNITASQTGSRLRFYTENTQKMTLLANGNLGIGNTAPTTSLHVERSSGNATQIVNATANNTRATIETKAKTSGGVEVRGVLGSYGDATKVDIGTLSNHDLSILTNNTERVRFMASGNVGIGTTSPEGRLHVEVLGSNATPPIKINRGLDGGRIQLQYSSNETGYGEIGQMYAGTGRTQIWIGANLNSFSTGHNSSPAQHDANYASWFSDWDSYIDRFTIGRIASGTTSRVMVINSAGSVGIGTDSPDALLEVEKPGSDVSSDPKLRITAQTYPNIEFYSRDSNSSNRNWKISSVFNSYGTFEFLRSSAANGVPNVTTLAMTSSGQVGIGIHNPTIDSSVEITNAAPNTGVTSLRLTNAVNNKGQRIDFEDDNGDRAFTLSHDNGSNITYMGNLVNEPFAFYTNSTEKMRLDIDGNMGIGTIPNGYLTSGYVARLYGGTQTYIAFNNSTHTTQVVGGFVIGNDQTAARITQRENQPIIFATNDIERMRISSDGNLVFNDSANITSNTSDGSDTAQIIIAGGGSASSADSRGASIHLAGNENGNGGLLQLRGGSGSVGGIRLYSAGSERMRITSDGNVGIGTTAPATGTHTSYQNLVIGETTSSTSGLSFKASTSGQSAIFFSDGTTPFNRGQVLYDHSTDSLTLASAGVEKLRLDGSGQTNVRLGGSTTNGTTVLSSCTSTSTSGGNGTGNTLELEFMEPSSPNFGAKKLRLGVQGGGYVKMDFPGSAGFYAISPYQANDKFHIGYGGVMLDMNGGGFDGNQHMIIRSKNDITFHPGGSERWRMIGHTSSTPAVFVTNQTTVTNIGGTPPDLNSLELGPGYLNLNRDDTVSATQIQFGKNGSVAGSIVTTSSTTYNTTSDRRAKENIVDAQDAGELIDGIRVREFDWKNSGEHQRYGMVAQELLEVAPEVVHQPDDEEQMMGVDYSKLVPMLVKEIQSLRARVAELEGE